MKRYTPALVAGLALLGACKETTVPDLNNPTVESVGGALTRTNLQTLLTGIVDQSRTATSGRYLVFTATLGRDAVRLDASEPRFISELLETEPASGGFLSGAYTDFLLANRAENNLLAAIPSAPEGEFEPGELEAVSGFVRTMKAYDLYRIVETKDTIGVPFDNADPEVTSPLYCKPSTLDYIAALLDSGQVELESALAQGITEFPVTLPEGFTDIGGDYSQIANLVKFNRGMAGKVHVYRGLDHQRPTPAAFDAAIAALDIALAGENGSTLDNGPYYQYSTTAGDQVNPLSDTKLHLARAVGDSIQAGDERAFKIVTQAKAASQTIDDVVISSKYDFFGSISDPATQTMPLGILRNEELVLLRAQAKIGKGDLPGATADLNIVRENSGGLAPYTTFGSEDAAIDALLYEKRYSLLFEGAQRLVDLRAYSRLNATSFPAGDISAPYTTDPYTSVLPFPNGEINARGGDLTVVCN